MLGLLYCESLLRWIEIGAISLVNADVVYYPLLIDIHQTMDPAVKWEQANFVYYILFTCMLKNSLTSSSIGSSHASRVYT